MPSNWTSFADLHGHLRPPLRPTPEDVAAFRGAIAGRNGRVLLLGVTPELSVLGNTLTAADGSERMVASVWSGNDARRHAVVADWLALPAAPSSFDAVIGDGSLNAVAEGLPPLLEEIARVLEPGGIAAFRTFCAPDEPESLDAIRRDMLGGRAGNFHAAKFRIAMALAARSPGRCVPVAEVLNVFESLFPDRRALCRAGGFDPAEVDTIDFYRGAGHSILYPTLGELLALARKIFPDVRVLPSTGYPLAERCPVVVFSKHGPSASGRVRGETL